MLKEIKIL